MRSDRRKFVASLAIGVFATLLISSTAFAGDGPSNFWYGADLSGPGPSGTSVPYSMPNCGGAYGSYVGRINTYPDPYGIATYSNAAAANGNAGYGIGPSSVFDVAGAGEDPSFNGTLAEAYSYGESQGSTAEANFTTFFNYNTIPIEPIIWADMEYRNGGYAQTPGGITVTQAENMQVFDGFYAWIEAHHEDLQGTYLTPLVGVYAGPSFWGTYVNGTLTNQFEWTPVVSYSTYSTGECAYGWQAPSGSTSHIADFFGGYSESSSCALMWQFISGSADYDQVDRNHITSCT